MSQAELPVGQVRHVHVAKAKQMLHRQIRGAGESRAELI
jgi:hypothetical protein